MATTEAQMRASVKYAKVHLKRIPFDLPKDGDGLSYESLKAAADHAGEPINRYIKTAIEQRMERDKIGE